MECWIFCINFTFILQVTSEQADYARGFEDALNEIRTKEQQHQQTTAQPQQQNGTTKFTSGAYWIVESSYSFAKYSLNYNNLMFLLSLIILATIPTTSATTSTILSMSGGSVTYTDLGKVIRTIFSFFLCSFLFAPSFQIEMETKILKS